MLLAKIHALTQRRPKSADEQRVVSEPVPTPDDCFQRLFDHIDDERPEPSADLAAVWSRLPRRVEPFGAAPNPFDAPSVPGHPVHVSVGTNVVDAVLVDAVPVGLPVNPFGESGSDGIRVVPMGLVA